MAFIRWVLISLNMSKTFYVNIFVFIFLVVVTTSSVFFYESDYFADKKLVKISIIDFLLFLFCSSRMHFFIIFI
jgi:hypothetical protein